MSKIEYLIVKDENKEEIIELYKDAGWWTKENEIDDSFVMEIVKNTFLFAVAKSEGKIIGMGRAISDGISDAYIQDVVVLKSFRKRGIGKGIIELLIRELKIRKVGWIALISEPGSENFYKELGFSEMKNYTPFIYEKGNNND